MTILHAIAVLKKMDIEKMIKPFNGTGDVSLWLKKVKFVVRTNKSKDLAAIIPLFLEDQAYKHCGPGRRRKDRKSTA